MAFFRCAPKCFSTARMRRIALKMGRLPRNTMQNIQKEVQKCERDPVQKLPILVLRLIVTYLELYKLFGIVYRA